MDLLSLTWEDKLIWKWDNEFASMGIMEDKTLTHLNVYVSVKEC